jgi:hypothetical protein
LTVNTFHQTCKSGRSAGIMPMKRGARFSKKAATPSLESTELLRVCSTCDSIRWASWGVVGVLQKSALMKAPEISE